MVRVGSQGKRRGKGYESCQRKRSGKKYMAKREGIKSHNAQYKLSMSMTSRGTSMERKGEVKVFHKTIEQNYRREEREREKQAESRVKCCPIRMSSGRITGDSFRDA